MTNKMKALERERARLSKSQNPQQVDFKKMDKVRTVKTEYWKLKKQRKVTAVKEKAGKKETKESKAKPEKEKKKKEKEPELEIIEDEPELEVIEDEPEIEEIDEELEELYSYDEDLDDELEDDDEGEETSE